MIIKTAKGYMVKSEKGKNLGGPYKRKEDAQKRLRQVEYFKQRKKLISDRQSKERWEAPCDTLSGGLLSMSFGP